MKEKNKTLCCPSRTPLISYMVCPQNAPQFSVYKADKFPEKSTVSFSTEQLKQRWLSLSWLFSSPVLLWPWPARISAML